MGCPRTARRVPGTARRVLDTGTCPCSLVGTLIVADIKR